MKERVDYLSFDEVDRLLNETGIPLDELGRYKCTIIASNVCFWDRLEMHDKGGRLILKNNQVFLRPEFRRRTPLQYSGKDIPAQMLLDF